MVFLMISTKIYEPAYTIRKLFSNSFHASYLLSLYGRDFGISSSGFRSRELLQVGQCSSRAERRASNLTLLIQLETSIRKYGEFVTQRVFFFVPPKDLFGTL